MGASHLPHMARRPAIFPSRYRSKFELVNQTQDREGAWHRLPASSLATADEVTE
jgi:hypothetical protein